MTNLGVTDAEVVSDPNGGCYLHRLYSVDNTQLVLLLLLPLPMLLLYVVGIEGTASA